jgi:hypothetical protein
MGVDLQAGGKNGKKVRSKDKGEKITKEDGNAIMH